MKNVTVGQVIVFVCSILLSFLFLNLSFNDDDAISALLEFKQVDPPFYDNEACKWADSLFVTLTAQEKVAQMMMAAVYPEKGENHFREIEILIRQQGIGGLIFFKGNALQVAQLVNRFQKVARVPLLMAVDGEWGLTMRLDSTVQYPKQMTLGAIQEEQLIYEMGGQVATQMKRLGLHVNFAPVVDVNNNPNNPVINIRSFGEDRYNVARKGILYMKGMQDKNILAVAKHFPGHGDTDVDSHHALPVISHPRNRIDSLELFPFRALISNGLAGIMTAHLHVPFLDSTAGLPATLSATITDTLLIQQLGFKGLVFTDAMNMGGVSGYRPVGANVLAALAGNDIVLMPDEIPHTIEHMALLFASQEDIQKRIDASCMKILQVKQWVGLKNRCEVLLHGLIGDLNKPEYSAHARKLYASALTLTRSSENLVPVLDPSKYTIANVVIANSPKPAHNSMIKNYARVRSFYIQHSASEAEYDKLAASLKDYSLVIVSVMSADIRVGKAYGLSKQAIAFTDLLLGSKNVILCLFANPYAASFFKNLERAGAVIHAFEDNLHTQQLVPQLIFGSLAPGGRLPVSATIEDTYNKGLFFSPVNRFRYVLPFEAGIDCSRLYKIDSIVGNALSAQAMPGCQIVAARNGMVFFQRSFGKHTYKGDRQVEDHDLYDLASLTKILATMPAIMHLSEDTRLDIDRKVSYYLPDLDTTNKRDINIKDILFHQAGLRPWIPFYMNTLEPVFPGQQASSNRYSDTYPIKIANNFFMNRHLRYRDNIYSSQKRDIYTVKVAENLFVRNDYTDSIFSAIAVSPLNGVNSYKYSDLGYYWFYRMIESITQTRFEMFLDSLFYSSMGAWSLCFNPLRFYTQEEIVPTENDLYFRRQLIHGYVHDMGAAMLGGVSGHAGLFGNAIDVAKVMQMFLDKGVYGGANYLEKKTVDEFTSCKACNKNRRGMGFDKPDLNPSGKTPNGQYLSKYSYGHTGFTGTIAWADPATDIVYVFLSNRIYPDAGNGKLAELEVRTNIHKVLQQVVMN